MDTRVEVKPRRQMGDDELDITPMIDIVFLLLAFFVVVSKMDPKPTVDLPIARYGIPVNEKEAINLIVRYSGSDESLCIVYGRIQSGIELSADPDTQNQEIEDFVAEEFSQNPDLLGVIIKTENGVKYQNTNRVFSAIKKAFEKTRTRKTCMGCCGGTAMSFSFQCPHCKVVLEVAEQMLGKTVRCSSCSNLISLDADAFGDSPETEAVSTDENAADSTNPYAAQSDEELISGTQSSKTERSAWKGESEVPQANGGSTGGHSDSGNGDGGDGDGGDGEFEQFAMPKGESRVDEEMDMTPMVDVTFLLLIFFMVTASFTLQKSMDLPTKTQDEPSPNVVEDFEDNQEYVSVFVSPYNEYRVRTPEYDWEDAPNRHELRVRLADALQGKSKPEKLLIMAHADCTHEKVIQAMDIGIELLYKIQVIMTEEEF